MQVDALVIAGGYNNDQLKKYSQVAKEALIPIGDKVMVEYVVEALEKTRNIKSIVVVGAVAELQRIFVKRSNNPIFLAEQGDTAIDSVINGIAMLKPKGRILIVTADIPLINEIAITGFLEACKGKDVDVFYPIIPKEINQLKYPNVKRTYATLKEGVFTGGNLFLVKPQVVIPCAEKAKQIVKLRKSPIALSSLVGWLFIVKFIFKIASLKEAEEKFLKLMGIEGKAIISPYPEIGIDVDKPSDLKLVREKLLPIKGE